MVRELFLAGGNRSSTATSGYGSCNHTGAKTPAGSAGHTEHGGRGLRGGLPHMARSSDRLWLKGSPVELPSIGGSKGQAAAILRLKIGRRDPPSVVTLTHLEHYA